jgi:hypothetical protein
VESGDHRSLIRKKGIYYRFYHPGIHMTSGAYGRQN